MTKFIEGKYRLPTGYMRRKLGTRIIQEMDTSGAVDDELWTILEYYSEIETVGLKYLLQHGVKNLSTRKKVFKHFQSHIRQAKSYYYSAKSLPPRSSGLLYYYCFHNLAKAVLVIKEPTIAGREGYHGLKYRVSNNNTFGKQTIEIKTDGVFPKLYNWYFGQSVKPTHLNISALFSYLTDISYQSQMAEIYKSKILYSYYAHCVNDKEKMGWGLVAIHQAQLMLKYNKALKKFLTSYEKVELPKISVRDMFGLDAYEQSFYTFFQSIKTKPWIGDNIPPEMETRTEIMELFRNVFQVNHFSNGFDFSISLPYSPYKQIRIDETISIYLIMFYLSNLIRYKPQYLENLLNKKESWLIDSFVKSCPITYLRSFISRIVGTDYIIGKR